MRCIAMILGMTLAAGTASALDFAAVRLAVYDRGESMYGDEFLAANEGVIDYIATLRRPTDRWDRIIYNCSVKERSIEPYVVQTNGTDPFTAYVPITTVYDIKDCVEAAN